MQFNVNTTAIVKFTAKLEKLHRSAFPSAVRGTLNKMVFDVKTKTMPAVTASRFTNRKSNFFKVNSKFENAAGFDVNSMKASIGFISTNLKGSPNYAVEDLEQQEFGGTIHKRSFIPMKSSRVGYSSKKPVRSNARLSHIKNLVDSKNATGKNEGQKFIKSVYHAGKGGTVLGHKGDNILWRVNSLRRTKDGALKLTPLYNFKKGRSVSVKAEHFMEKAATLTMQKSDVFYMEEANRQFSKYL